MKKYGNYNKTLADRFFEIRTNLKLTREELSEILNCSPQQIYNMETAKRGITIQTAKLFASAFRFNFKYLLDESVIYASDIQEFNSVMKQSQYEGDLMLTIIISLAKLNGYELDSKAIHNEEIISLKDYFAGRKEFLILKKDNNQLSLSDEDINRIGNNISDKFQSDIDLITYFKSKNHSNT